MSKQYKKKKIVESSLFFFSETAATAVGPKLL